MRYKNGDYIFASACVRGMERNLLDSKRLTKLMAVKNTQEALRVLSEIGYSTEEASRGSDGALVDAMLSGELGKAYEQIESLLPEKHALDAFLYIYDFHNLKVLIKAELSETNPEDFLVDIGTIKKDELTVMLRERNFINMPQVMRDAVGSAFETYAKTKDPQQIDFILDKACYIAMKASAKESGSDFLVGYVSLLVDTINLKSFARLKEMGKPWTSINKVYLPGGDIPESVLAAGFEEDYSHFAERLRSYNSFEDVMAKGGSALSETGRFTVLETLCDDAVTDYLSKAKYVSYGIEVPIAYLAAKEGEIRLVRIVLAGIAQGLSPEQMAQRIRRTYV